MIRRLLNLLTLLSLVMLVATAWLYVRQRKLGRAELELLSVYWARLHARYTVRADAGGVWLYRPPFVRALRPPDLSGRAASLVGKLANSQIGRLAAALQRDRRRREAGRRAGAAGGAGGPGPFRRRLVVGAGASELKAGGWVRCGA